MNGQWQGIAITTVMLRLLMFPVVVYTMRNNVGLMNIMPQTKVHQERLQSCKERGDMAGQAEATKNLMAVYEKHGVGPFKGFKGILIQAPVRWLGLDEGTNVALLAAICFGVDCVVRSARCLALLGVSIFWGCVFVLLNLCLQSVNGLSLPDPKNKTKQKQRHQTQNRSL